MTCNEILSAGKGALLEGLLAGQHVKRHLYQADMDLGGGIRTIALSGGQVYFIGRVGRRQWKCPLT